MSPRHSHKQLSLELGSPPPSTFDNFFVSANREPVARLRDLPGLVAREQANDRLFYLWGDMGSGRTHLLHAVCDTAIHAGLNCRYLSPHHALADFTFDPACQIYTVDNVDLLDEARQIAVFSLYNEVRAHVRCALVVAGGLAPRAMPVREDLRTRLGWGLVYQLQPLSDEDKMAALVQAAKERGLQLSPEIPHWLVTRHYRDMPSLMALLDALDMYALERKRAVTLPLLREMFAEFRE
ncbi:DnaA regulatory inactivator Hda [Cupriavidus sp.]|jgi:DnaA family protein|uniref:DnaA regulatory inactivator Hda n=1 Tax=Cupriavidus sp. TaxID=1873897 RepID=UPI0025BF7CC8|nr:DnaA regulatory inactivator Hda [Cupriavidus sp.]MCA3185730.1 DnaA regulatory inactivator Hda [Cupriavidus sp.]MCA3191135.1 DnaA regulatory inactivator Hda [Cupriavidus sp.]MCA3195193.1 DnaA regulatory inactivator Hda [Cupriavidus sp.]MCA3204163.1 DnaA regulatory inactivator Hda [Cupriavidus sp.]MCA3208975.1 DnaA regulatory inactivator Hda [Cupriavidus sp.]